MMEKPYEQWGGIIPALITPYTSTGAINEPVTRQLVEHLIAKGVAGLYLCGSTGEGFLQTIGERKQLLEIVLNVVNRRIPVITHVGAMDTATSVELTEHAARVGASAVSSVAPFYYKHRQEEIKQHYLDIVNAADIPLIIYHFPANTGIHSNAAFYRELSQVDGIIGVKFTSTDMFELQQTIDSCGEQFLVFNGPDEICLSGLVIGCCGAIGSTYNIMPGLFVELFRQFKQGNIRRARQMQFEVNRGIVELLKYDFIAFEREILRLQGFDVGKPRKPIQQLSARQRAEIRKLTLRYPCLMDAGTTASPEATVAARQ